MRDLARLPFLHVYSQTHWHGPAEIRGTREGLEALAVAIQNALAGQEGQADVLCTDGEGYGLFVRRVNVIGLIGPLPYDAPEFGFPDRSAWQQKPSRDSDWDNLAIDPDPSP